MQGMRRFRTCRAAGIVALTLVAGVTAAGCARLGIQPDPDPSEVVTLPDSMVLMPVADARSNPYTHGEVRHYVREAAGKVLTKKGYVIVPHHVLEGAERPPLDGIGDMTGPELAALGPDEAQWLLFVSVTKVSEGYDSAGEAFHIGVAGIVVNREDGSILWRSAGSGQASKRGGLLRLLPPTPPERNAVYDAMQSLFAYVPSAGAS
jgi:hypothetical protein